MNEPEVLRFNCQVVIHRRNKRLHDLIDIAGQVWNYCVAYQRWHIAGLVSMCTNTT